MQFVETCLPANSKGRLPIPSNVMLFEVISTLTGLAFLICLLGIEVGIVFKIE
jgi:hypothetical protein